MKHMGLFEGIGGFSLAARWAGWITPVMVEWNQYCQSVLRKNFPDATIFSDIRNFDGRPYAGQIDIITGGFPCQPFSHAGKRAGTDDDRYLWPEMLRVIREVGPEWIVGENVAGLLTMDGGRVLRGILADLENTGYRPEVFVIPALAVGAPHRRDRLWIVAHRDSGNCAVSIQPQVGRVKEEDNDASWENCGHTWYAASAGEPTVVGLPQGPTTDAVGNGARNRPPANTDGARCEKLDAPAKPGFAGFGSGGIDAVASNADNDSTARQRQYSGGVLPFAESARFNRCHWQEPWHEVATRICGMDDGIPGGVDGVGEIPAKKNTGKASRLESLGNAIVPEIAYKIFKAINKAAQ